jgi:MFS family permease
MQTKKKFFLSLILFSLVWQIAWVVENMYLNVFIYKMFGASPAQISAMISASAITATVTTLLIGALSDKLGKRKAFMCGGYLLWGVSILGFALVNTETVGSLFSTAASINALCVTLVIVLDCLMTFFGSTANDACFNAWLTDMTDGGTRGRAEGINAMMPLVAILCVFGGFMSFDLSLSSAWTVIFCIIGAVVLLIGLCGLFLIEEPKLDNAKNERYFANIVYGFRLSVVKKNPELYLCLLAFALFGISIQIFMPYLILYYTEALKMQNYVFVMAPAIVLASAFTVISRLAARESLLLRMASAMALPVLIATSTVDRSVSNSSRYRRMASISLEAA